MTDYFDKLETRDPAERQAALFGALGALITHAQTKAPGFARRLAGIDGASIASIEALRTLPITRKSELIEAQRAALPFAGLTALGSGGLARIFSSPGPIYDPEGRAADWWRFARALFAAGFRAGDLIHNCFSYHFSPAGFMVESGAGALGCAVFPGGTGQTEQQARAVADLRPTGYAGTPSFLKMIVDKGAELALDTGSLSKALVSGEYLSPGLRQEMAERGIAVRQCYASADLGLIAYESQAMEGLVVDEQVIVEILCPGTGKPVADGEAGEVVVTSFNRDYPLIRFATGDLSAAMTGPSPCGRTNLRLKGWLGRADQTVKVKGLFVHPTQIGDLIKRHGEIERARLVVERLGDSDAMVLHIETNKAEICPAVAQTLQNITKLRGDVLAVALGSLPKDGKLIEDKRPLPGA